MLLLRCTDNGQETKLDVPEDDKQQTTVITTPIDPNYSLSKVGILEPDTTYIIALPSTIQILLVILPVRKIYYTQVHNSKYFERPEYNKAAITRPLTEKHASCVILSCKRLNLYFGSLLVKKKCSLCMD